MPPSTTSLKPAQAQISKLEQESKDKFHTQEIKDFDAAHSKFNEPNHSLTHSHTHSLSLKPNPLPLILFVLLSPKIVEFQHHTWHNNKYTFLHHNTNPY